MTKIIKRKNWLNLTPTLAGADIVYPGSMAAAQLY